MSASATARLVTRTLTCVVLVVSAVYLMVYLYRWEWNRAVISGVFFLAAEVVVATTVVSARLARLERRIDGVAAAEGERRDDVDIERESPFAWLDPASGRMVVFVPLLMGAGVILSAIAFLVEKLSGAMAHGGAPRSLGARVGPALPVGGVLPSRGATTPVALDRSRPRATTGSPVVVGLALALGAVVAFQGIALVADATQSRPDPHPEPTTLDVDVQVRGGRSATQEATTLAFACQGSVTLDEVDVIPAGAGRARLTVTGVMGKHARRKFTGCLEDATLERVRASVVAVSVRPTGVGPSS